MMHTFSHLKLFINNNFKQIKRKWYLLPLLLLFPIILIGLVIIIISAFLQPDEENPVRIGLVDLDQSEEIQMITTALAQTNHLGSMVELSVLNEPDASQQLDADELTAYVVFPEDFTNDLYRGKSVNLSVVGNSQQLNEAYLVKELMDSVTRHINTSQANILMINDYADRFGMDYEERKEYLFEQFKSFFLFSLSKDKLMDEEKLVNQATVSPFHYYTIAAWFISIIVWLLLFFNFLYKEDVVRIKKRMLLYGVKEWQQILARVIVSLFIVMMVSALFFIGIQRGLAFELYVEDYFRIGLIVFLFSMSYLMVLAVIEVIVTSQKLRLLCQVIVTGLLIGLSGALLPVIYLPLAIQDVLPYVFSAEGFYWIQEIMLNGRFYAEYNMLLVMSGISFMIFILLSLWKERVRA
ncbi:MAG TPA: ABC transporter permease [Cerasibacillus sp.]|uniref:ABC transporter permease n=1 Tax=Cerasibacillus sp. TaxID=2498711 RepID=UPI002F409D03